MRNIEYINKKIAKDKDLKEEVVRKINEFYWNTVKTSLRTVDDEFIHIKEIGTFSVSRRKLQRQIELLREFIKNVRYSNKYTDTKKEEIIKTYKAYYSKCVNMRRTVNQTIEFRDSYKNNDDV